MDPAAHCICVIQARVGSDRLRNKVSKPLKGVAVLQWVIARCKAIPAVDTVICALPESAENDELVALANEAGAVVVRGSETDVLSRFVKALRLYPSRYVMRVTADCPLLDPAVCGDLMQFVSTHGLDYGVTAGWPHGLDCEVVSSGKLLEADRMAISSEDREHVTLWIKRNHPENHYIHRPDQDYMPENRWVIDYPEDYSFLQALMDYLPPFPVITPWREILAIVDEHPDLRQINRKCSEVWLRKTNQIYQAAASHSD